MTNLFSVVHLGYLSIILTYQEKMRSSIYHLNIEFEKYMCYIRRLHATLAYVPYVTVLDLKIKIHVFHLIWY